MSIFRLYPGLKVAFQHNSVRKNLFLSACFCWDSRLSLREIDQKYKFGGTIGYGNSYLELIFRHFKKLRLHAILHDAAGAVRAHSGKGPGYCYMIRRGPNSCSLGDVTGLLFFLLLREDNICLGKIVFDDNNQERKSLACLGQTCSRSLIVFLSQHFVFLLIIFGCFCRIHLPKTCDESTVWVGFLCSAAGYILPSPRL